MALGNTIRPGGPDAVAVVTGWERVHWGAVFAGLFFTIVAQILLTVLGLAIGLTAVDPRQGVPEGIGWGAAIWGILSLLISLFIGGYMTGRLAGAASRRDGALNASLTWAVSLVAMLYLVGTGAGSLVSGVFGMVGSVAQTTAQVAGQDGWGSGGGTAAERAREAARSAGIDVDRMQQRAEDTLAQAGETAEQMTQPGTPENQQAREAAAQAADYAATGAWALLIGALLGLLVAAWAGALGAAADLRRTTVVAG